MFFPQNIHSTLIISSLNFKTISHAMAIKTPSKLLQGGNIIQVFKRLTKFAKTKHNYNDHLPSDVPEGHFAVYVGENRSRHIVHLSCLNQPGFQALLEQSEKEFGFRQEKGLTIPCDEVVFLSVTSTRHSILGKN